MAKSKRKLFWVASLIRAQLTSFLGNLQKKSTTHGLLGEAPHPAWILTSPWRLCLESRAQPFSEPRS